jgi:hypothetical protein
VDVVLVGSIQSSEAYSQIALKQLCPHVATSHVLLVQWDGYVVDAAMWQPAFLDVDYIGAPWPNGSGGYVVGNGGFSLRSRKLLEVLNDDSFPLLTTNEDVTICGLHRPRLEAEYGIRFASTELARRFSFEMETAHIMAGAKTFGFHGIFNLFLVEPMEQIEAVAARMSDQTARLDTLHLLLQNFANFGLWEGAVALGRRILSASPENTTVAEIVVHASEQMARRSASPNRYPYPRFLRRITQLIRSTR